MLNKKKYEVIMSVYSPDYDFLLKQLESILSQVEVQIKLIIRLDGPDTEAQIFLDRYFENKKIEHSIILGQHIGACASYIELLMRASPDCNVAFVDQDDLWSSDRLKELVEVLAFPHPILAVSSMAAIDSRILELGDISLHRVVKNPRFVAFENALVENVIQGARMVLNPSAVKLLQENKPDTSRLVMHDAWVYLVMSAFGSIIFNQRTTFFYRQHANNLIGLSSNKFLRRLNRFLTSRNKQRYKMAFEFSRIFSNFPEAEKARLFADIPNVSLRRKISILRDIKLLRQRKADLVMYFISCIFTKS